MKESKQTEIKTDENGRRYREIPQKNAFPLWTAAAVWGIAMFCFPMYRILFILLTAALSVCGYLLVKKLMPREMKREYLPSGNTEAENCTAAMFRTAEKLRANSAATAVSAPTVSAQMKDIADVIDKMREAVLKDPTEAGKMRKFLNYYLPVTEKLTTKYVELSIIHLDGENVAETRASIENILGSVRAAYEKQYDALYEDDALDITTDVAVLEAKMKMDHLNETQER